jgi:micrococcal nuclease
MINNLYHYKATVNRVVDGDTAELTIDLGFTVKWKSTCRFYGINTPELNSRDIAVKQKAKDARLYVSTQLIKGLEVLIISRELDKYGRPLVDIYYGEGFTQHINQELVDKQLAVIYIM